MSKENIYKKALEDIAGASDQANPAHIKVVAQTALSVAEEPIMDENYPSASQLRNDEYINTGDDIEYKFKKDQEEIAGYNKKFSEEAESAWRDTVLHPDYKSPFDEEEE